MSVTPKFAFNLPPGSSYANRTSGGTLYFYCTTEAELPTVDVIDGDSAYAANTGKYWDRTAGAWVQRVSGLLANALQDSSNAVLSIGAITDGQFLKRSGTNIISGALAWGGISGTLSSQTDLQSALNVKLDTNGNGSSLTGLTKSQVGLGSVENTALSTWAGSANITTVGAVSGTSLVASGVITAVGGMGYATGAGGTVTQATSKSTGVTLNKWSGEVTLNAASLAAATIVSFTLTNSVISAKDVMVLNHSATGTSGAYGLNAQCAAGSAIISVRNNTAGALAEAIVLRFAVVKAATT